MTDASSSIHSTEGQISWKQNEGKLEGVLKYQGHTYSVTADVSRLSESEKKSFQHRIGDQNYFSNIILHNLPKEYKTVNVQTKLWKNLLRKTVLEIAPNKLFGSAQVNISITKKHTAPEREPPKPPSKPDGSTGASSSMQMPGPSANSPSPTLQPKPRPLPKPPVRGPAKESTVEKNQTSKVLQEAVAHFKKTPPLFHYVWARAYLEPVTPENSEVKNRYELWEKPQSKPKVIGSADSFIKEQERLKGERLPEAITKKEDVIQWAKVLIASEYEKSNQVTIPPGQKRRERLPSDYLEKQRDELQVIEKKINETGKISECAQCIEKMLMTNGPIAPCAELRKVLGMPVL